MTRRFRQDPQANLDYGFDWSGWLRPGDTIVTSTFIVASGLTKGTESHTDTTTSVFVSGGTVGVSYDITNHITTAQGRADDRTLTITIEQQ